ncbi:hypothetical protein NOG12_07880 [Pseudidiomarina sp. GXY010]|uniref:Uncharacterized protein n=1 Tax=Pseudidiomarina fusca TaxID=2965078 RepID=A0ABU3KX22_9GAMM|nr:hypothetical protein [Pseudidiomarina sp. GXY010]MDT7525990.1 hypothetical protein [Pseudidiomarina sp. GXY010]
MSQDNHWQIIKLAEFERPSAPASTRIEQLVQHLRNLFPSSEQGTEESEAKDFPGYRDFDLAPAADALDEAWQEWLASDGTGVKFLVSPPFSGTAAISRAWAERHQLPVLQAPEAELFAGVDIEAWWQPQAAPVWVIDHLADYWQRQTNGLAFIRALLPKLMRGELGKGIVVCDSWSFAFLQRAWPVHLPQVYCFSAATEALLQQVGIQAPSKQLRALAARAMGNVGLALALWAVTQDDAKDLPAMPADCGDASAFVLYALLLHNGLSGAALQSVLPTLAADQLDVQLLQLQQADLVECNQGKWEVTVYGYLAAHDFLNSRGYFMDSF